MIVYRKPMSKKNLGLLPLLVICVLLLTAPAATAKSGEEFNLEGGAVKKDNLFNLFFGGAPLMPTQHGTVIVEAFHDRNDNQQRDEGEEILDKKVVVIVEEVVYPVPAFIPGLANGMNYTFLFEGEQFQPSFRQKEVFIKKRGQIIRLEIPCRPGSQPSAVSGFGLKNCQDPSLSCMSA